MSPKETANVLQFRAMKKRAEDIGLNTAKWRKWAAEAFDKMPRGARSRCAREIGARKEEITKILQGQRRASQLVRKVDRWLIENGASTVGRGSIDPLEEIRLSVVEEMEAAQDVLDEADYEHIRNVIRHLAGRGE